MKNADVRKQVDNIIFFYEMCAKHRKDPSKIDWKLIDSEAKKAAKLLREHFDIKEEK